MGDEKENMIPQNIKDRIDQEVDPVDCRIEANGNTVDASKVIKTAMMKGAEIALGSQWIDVNERKPELIKDKDWSANVLAWQDGGLMIMAYCYVDGEDEAGEPAHFFAWCNCYGDIYGDPQFDDNYYPTHWMPLPEKPQP